MLLGRSLLLLTGKVNAFCHLCFNTYSICCVAKSLYDCESLVPHAISNPKKREGVFASELHKY